MQEYKWICKTENCSSILVSQLNREIEKRLDTAFEEIKVADRFDVIIDTSTKEEDYSLVKAQYLNLNQELEEEPLN